MSSGANLYHQLHKKSRWNPWRFLTNSCREKNNNKKKAGNRPSGSTADRQPHPKRQGRDDEG
eukprot:12330187-Prorocentrum_lima.AAC.1